MKIQFRESFERDLKKIKNPPLLKQIKKLIFKIESCSALTEIPNVKKLAGGNNFYRIRLGDYRVGLYVGKSVVEFVRVLHRKEIYRYFP